jgi:ABC-type dipeptide/oligopeptide/nickel transport system ATPase component
MATCNPNNILEVSGLETIFRTEQGIFTAVKGVSFELRKGETLGIVGESGSGKSVTALSIMNLIPSPPGRVSGGELWFNSPSAGWTELRQLPQEGMRKFRGNEV